MDDDVEELSARLEGLRLALVMVVRGLEDPTKALVGLHGVEQHARIQNMHAATIEEIAGIREALDDL